MAYDYLKKGHAYLCSYLFADETKEEMGDTRCSYIVILDEEMGKELNRSDWGGTQDELNKLLRERFGISDEDITFYFTLDKRMDAISFEDFQKEMKEEDYQIFEIYHDIAPAFAIERLWSIYYSYGSGDNVEYWYGKMPTTEMAEKVICFNDGFQSTEAFHEAGGHIVDICMVNRPYTQAEYEQIINKTIKEKEDK